MSRDCQVCCSIHADDVLSDLAAGASVRDVAKTYGLSPSSVHRHRRNGHGRLAARSTPTTAPASTSAPRVEPVAYPYLGPVPAPGAPMLESTGRAQLAEALGSAWVALAAALSDALAGTEVESLPVVDLVAIATGIAAPSAAVASALESALEIPASAWTAPPKTKAAERRGKKKSP